MPHSPQPFFKEKRRTWYVEVGRVQYVLGRHPDTLPLPQKGADGKWRAPQEILAAFYAKMVELGNKPAARPRPARRKPVVAAADSVAAVVERYLDWCESHRAAGTFGWYHWRLKRFVAFVGLDLKVSELKPLHLDDWFNSRSTWSSGMKHGMARAVLRATSWAKRRGHIENDPLAGFEKPKPGKRTLVISPEEFREILEVAREPFKTLIEVTWETGCRPQESLAVEARHLDEKNARWVFPPDESKGEKWPRIVYLSDRALAITKALAQKHPEGPLFRNSAGDPWTPYAVNCAWVRIQLSLGMKQIVAKGLLPPALPPLPDVDRTDPQKRAAHEARVLARQKQIRKLASAHGRKYCMYHLRHSWLNRKLKSGMDALTAAILMGHRDPSTISRTYQHLSQAPDYLREQARRSATGS